MMRRLTRSHIGGRWLLASTMDCLALDTLFADASATRKDADNMITGIKLG